MFGYVKPDRPYLYIKDETLYKALYCGVCKSIGKTCGGAARFSLTYDITFLSAVAHNLLKKDVKITRQRCAAHPFTKRPVAEPDELSLTLGALNVILAYFKVCDDVADNGRGRFKRLLLSGGFKRAKKREEKLCEIVERNYKALAALEKTGENRIDAISDPFANMLTELSREVLGEVSDEYSDGFFYQTGKWIYLIDALDDYDEDVKKGNYNPFYACYKSENFTDLKKEFGGEISFIMGSVVSLIDENLDNLKFGFNADLIRNIASRGTKERTKQVLLKLSGEKPKKEKD